MKLLQIQEIAEGFWYPHDLVVSQIKRLQIREIASISGISINWLLFKGVLADSRDYRALAVFP